MYQLALPVDPTSHRLPVELDPTLWQTQANRADGHVCSLSDLLAASYTDAFVVVYEGVVRAEYYAPGYDGHTAHPLYSITKSFVGALAGILQDDGRLDPQRAASDYVPEIGWGGYANATVRDLLDMRTGGDYVEDHLDPHSEINVLGAIAGWGFAGAQLGAATAPPDAALSVRDYLACIPRQARSGGPFAYRSADTEVLGWVIERAGASTLAELLGHLLMEPLGKQDPGFLLADRHGLPVASGGLNLSPYDVVRFGQAMLLGGTNGARQVFSPMFIRDVRWGQDDSVAAFQRRFDNLGGPDQSQMVSGLYRNQFWVPHRGGRQVLCLGIHGQVLLIDPDNSAVVLKLSSWPQAQDRRLFTDGLVAVATAAMAVGGHFSEGLSLLA